MTPSLATVDVVHATHHTVAVLRGELDMSNADDVDRRLRSHLPVDGGTVVVHLDEVTYLDSSGLRLLADLAQEPSLELIVVAPDRGNARQALVASRLDQHLDVRDAPPGE